MSCNNSFPSTGDKCRKSIGGIKKIYAINKNNVEFIHYDVNNTDMIDFILPANDAFKEINFIKDSASLTTTFVGDPTTGSGEYTSELVFKINEDFYETKMGYMENIPVLFVIRNYKDEYYCLGDKTPAYLTNGVHYTGASLGDFNGEELTFTIASDKPLHKCVVGEEMASEVGSFSNMYISEKILNGGNVTRTPKEVDSGEITMGVGVNMYEYNQGYFCALISYNQDTEPLFGDIDNHFIMIDEGLGNYNYIIKDGSDSTITFSTEVKDQAQKLATEIGETVILTKKYKQYLVGNQFEKMTNKLVLCDFGVIDFIAATWNSDFSNAEMMQFDISVEYCFEPTGTPEIYVYVQNPIAISGLK